MYPSLLLHMDQNPASDRLGVFIPLLRELREYRLKYKKLSRETEDRNLQQEYQARQTSFKIIINSFYGYLGFEGARFADGQLAAHVTEQGRELLQKLIERFQQEDCVVLEADTDGIYVSAPNYYEQADTLLEKVSDVMPSGIDLECDGQYQFMFCYKAKNYALYDGKQVTVKGSALKSRGTEPFLKQLTNTLIEYQLGASDQTPKALAESLRQQIRQGDAPISLLAKKEYLSQSPEKYLEAVQNQGKPRRASLEAVQRMKKKLKMGDQVSYYITYGEKKRMPDWQLARPVEEYDPNKQPYQVDYYLKKIDDWEKRNKDFLE